MKRVTLCMLTWALALPGIAQVTSTQAVDELISILEENDRWMGSLAIAEGGEVSYQRAIGFRNAADELMSDTDTRYRIGSISKMFTAVLTFQAVEAGKISLSSTLEKHFPEVPNASEITVAMLLHHNSGVFSITSLPDYLEWSDEEQSRRKLYGRIIDKDPEFAPGEQHEYSNSNYILLTWLLEDLYKTSFAALLQNQIIKPLGLKNTYLGEELDLINHECYSYKYAGSWLQEQVTDMSVPLGAGAVVSTPSDLTLFIRGLFQDRLIQHKHLEAMMDFQEGYGMGMFRYKIGEQYAYGHTGGIDGFSSFLGYLPETDVAVALTSNGTRFDNMKIVEASFKAVSGEKINLPDFSNYTVAIGDLDQYVGVYASPDIPLKLTIFVENEALMAQATGQSSFPLDPTSEHNFSFELAGIEIEFAPEDSTLTLIQGGQPITFTKE